MLMKYIFTILVFSISYFTYAQDLDGIPVRIMNMPGDSLPKFIIKMDEVEYLLDTVPASINPNWIEKIEVLKTEEQENIYGNGNGLVLIYPKKEYFEQISLLYSAISKNKGLIEQEKKDSIYYKSP